MNKNSYTVSIITSLLDQIESNAQATPMEAIGLLDELRRLERKWREQVAAGSSRRIDSDFRTLNGWYRRWLLAAKTIAKTPVDDDALAARMRAEMESVAKTLKA